MLAKDTRLAEFTLPYPVKRVHGKQVALKVNNINQRREAAFTPYQVSGQIAVFIKN